MRKILIEVETDSDDSIDSIKRDIAMELSCCYTYFYLDTMKVSERLN